MIVLAALLFAAGAQAAPLHAKHKAKSATKSASTQTAAPSAAEQTRIKALMQYQRDLVTVLALRGDAIHLLGAALLSLPLPNMPAELSFHNLIERAAKAPAASPGVTWLRMADCDAKANACPNPDMLAALEKQVPDNAAVWMLVMDGAAAKNDTAAMRGALTKAAAGKPYDDYFGIGLQGLANAVGTLPPLPDTMTGTQPGEPTTALGVEELIAFGVANQHPMPSLKPLLQMCTVDATAKDDALKSDCVKTAHNLEWGSSPLARAVGLHIHGQLDPSAKAQTDIDSRNLGWQLQNYGMIGVQGLNNDKLAQQLLDSARSGGTELSLILSTLRDNGIPTEAPADWQPQAPQAASSAGASK